jgi:heme A synthase
MDLILLVLGLALLGFLVYLITTKIPMDPMLQYAIQIIVVVAVVIYLVRRFGDNIPNMLG